LAASPAGGAISSRFFNRTAGVPVITAFALGVSGILLLMPQGRDLVRCVGEDGLGRVAIAFAIGILFFAIQAWSWSRIVIASNYGTNRTRWRPRWLLEWGPRVLAFPAFYRGRSPAPGQFQVERARRPDPIGDRRALPRVGHRPRADNEASRGDTQTAPWVQATWVIAGLAMAFGAMVVAILRPQQSGVGLGGPAIVFFGLGFIIPLITIACQLGSARASGFPSPARSSCGRFFSVCSSTIIGSGGAP
jgi:hypothetical protein